MEKYKAGMLARSMAGHDRGKVYVIIDADDAYIYLADGRIRTLDKLKKKKKKHVQLILREYDMTDTTDVKIKRLLKIFNKEEK
ncbi:MAG: KOW domain-containing RNA-binding protein [Lachnospiraceae bacterium]